MTSSWIELISVGLGSGVLTQIGSYFISKRQQSSIDYSAIISTWQEDNKRLREFEEESRRRISELETTVNRLQNKVILLESATQDLPIPMWLKDLDGKMLALNTAYEQLFLLPNGLSSVDYIGKTDFDVWPKEVAKQFEYHDNLVKSSKRVLRTTEKVPVGEKEEDYIIVKFPRFAGRTVIGIAGIAIDKDLTNI